jgi:hypothetical protein
MSKILLLNFTESDAGIISKAGFAVERGYLGAYQPQEYWAFQTPHPIYEYDVLIYNSADTLELENEFTKQNNLLKEKGSLEALTNFAGTPYLRIYFAGQYNGLPTLLHGGLPFLNLTNAEQNISLFFETTQVGATFAIREMHRLVAGLKGDISAVHQFLSSGDINPFNHFPVLVSRSGQEVAAYGTKRDTAGKAVPKYVVLPNMKNAARASVEILQVVEKVRPQLFPDRNKNSWLDGAEFMLPDELAKEKELQDKTAEILAVEIRLRGEIEELKKENAFIRQLLTATEEPKVQSDQRLSAVVRKSFEFLGFSVQDIDQRTKSAIRKEDFWVSEADFFAITEVTGTSNTNPKVKEFHDILGRIATIYKRQTDLIPEGISNVSGLLVLNYDYERHPDRRPKAYTGEWEHIIESAIEQSIGILSTVELHKIIMAVKKGNLTKEHARLILKKPGRIEYDG